MSQIGSPSGSPSAPELVAARLKVQFAPDVDALRTSLEQAETMYGESITRIKAMWSEMLAEIGTKMEDMAKLRESMLVSDPKEDRRESGSGPAEAKVDVDTQILAKLTDITRNTETITVLVENIDATLPTLMRT